MAGASSGRAGGGPSGHSGGAALKKGKHFFISIDELLDYLGREPVVAGKYFDLDDSIDAPKDLDRRQSLVFYSPAFSALGLDAGFQPRHLVTKDGILAGGDLHIAAAYKEAVPYRSGNIAMSAGTNRKSFSHTSGKTACYLIPNAFNPDATTRTIAFYLNDGSNDYFQWEGQVPTGQWTSILFYQSGVVMNTPPPRKIYVPDGWTFDIVWLNMTGSNNAQADHGGVLEATPHG